MYIAIDFDGTIVRHEYPKIGEPLPGAIFYLDRFIKSGAKLILFTMRSGKTLAEAEKFLKALGIEFYGINVNPDQYRWTQSPKAWAHLYIDDAGHGCPLVTGDGKPYVDWPVLGPEVLAKIKDHR